MQRIVRLVRVSVPLALGLSCQQTLPTAPSDLATGIVIYEFQDYQGESAHVIEDIPDLDNVDGPCNTSDDANTIDFDFDDCISSVQIAPGWGGASIRAPQFRRVGPNHSRRRV